MRKNDEKGWVTVGENDGNQNKPEKEKSTFEVDGQKYSPYDAVDKVHRFPVWLKASAMKWWIPGAVFYFIGFGFQGLQGGYVLMTILGLVWGLATDIFLNHFFRELSSPDHDYTKYVFCGRNSKRNLLWKFLTLPINLLYGLVLSFSAGWIINSLLLRIAGSGTTSTDEIMFMIGPLLYATVMFIGDMMFSLLRTFIEWLIKKIVKIIEDKKSKEVVQTEKNSLENTEVDNSTSTNENENK